jgi:hypothetical protein
MKTAMIGQYLQRDRLSIPKEQARELYARQRPLGNMTVKLGRRRTKSSQIVRVAYAKIDTAAEDYLATAAFGELLVQIAALDARYGLPASTVGHYLHQIWRSSRVPVEWPPERYIEDVGGFDLLAAGFNARWLPDPGTA